MMMSRSIHLIALAAAAVSLPLTAREGHDFGPLRIGIKMVTGHNGNDHGGELRGGKGEEMCRLMKELGCDLTRIELRWTLVERERGVYDWSEYDRLVDLLISYDIEPMFMMYCAPEWAMVGPPEDKDLFIRLEMENLYTVVWPRTEYKPEFARFIETAASRFKGRVRLFEYWNEPDGMAGPTVLRDEEGKATSIRFGGDPILYADWLRVMYPALKRGNPDAVLCVGSLTNVDGRFIEAVYASGCGDMIDAVSVHPYAHDGVRADFIDNVRQVMTRYGDWEKPIWLTEFGWSCQNDPESDSAKHQANVIRKVFSRIEERFPFVSQAYFFTLNNWRDVEHDPQRENGFGIVNYYLKKKPGFEAMKEVMKEGRKPVRRDRPACVTVTGPGVPIDVAPDEPLTIDLTSHNPFDDPAEARVTLDMPWNHKETTRSVMFTASPGAMRVPLEPISLSSLPPGSYELGVNVPEFPPHTLNVTVPYEAEYLSTSPLLKRGRGDSDSRPTSWIQGEGFRAWFGWDDENLYFACDVDDDEHHQTIYGSEMWNQDSVQLAIDPLRDGVRGAGFRPDDSEYIFALTGLGPIAWRTATIEPRHVGRVRSGSLDITRDETTARYRVAIPWMDISPYHPEAGSVLGVSILVNDWKDGEHSTHNWGGGIAERKEPYRYAAVRLMR